ncbi:uncharacterized protein LOC116942018 [Petromyzon marinus]|uniref:uncharacterized protein LOC116942018 n=1 Tax=Petromyzon marinus TaxID=7757 RepID=UPI003F6F1A2A
MLKTVAAHLCLCIMFVIYPTVKGDTCLGSPLVCSSTTTSCYAQCSATNAWYKVTFLELRTQCNAAKKVSFYCTDSTYEMNICTNVTSSQDVITAVCKEFVYFSYSYLGINDSLKVLIEPVTDVLPIGASEWDSNSHTTFNENNWKTTTAVINFTGPATINAINLMSEALSGTAGALKIFYIQYCYNGVCRRTQNYVGNNEWDSYNKRYHMVYLTEPFTADSFEIVPVESVGTYNLNFNVAGNNIPGMTAREQSVWLALGLVCRRRACELAKCELGFV